MRWTKRYTRYIKRFAIFPIKIKDEIRWLETVYLRQYYDVWTVPFSMWKNKEFVTAEEYKASGDVSICDRICEFLKRFRKGE